MRRYQVISCDGHLETPMDGWLSYMPEKYRALAPRLVKLPDGGEAWLIEGYPLVHNGSNVAAGGRLKLTGASYWDSDGAPMPGTGGPKQRLQEQDTDGIDAELLYPPVFVSRFIEGMSDKNAYIAMISAYNEWLTHDYCSHAPDRLIAVGMIPAINIKAAVEELEHCHRLGVQAVVLSQFPNGSSLPDASDSLFWDKAIELSMPLTAHVGIGSPNHPMLIRSAAGRFDPAMVLMRSCLPAILPFLTETIGSGLFDRHPDLKFFIAESNAGWVPEVMLMMDDNYATFRDALQMSMQKTPSDYILDHFCFGIFKDPVAIENRHRLPLKNLMWCSDFPHVITTYPNSRQHLNEMFRAISDEDRRLVLLTNPCEFFGIDPTRAITPTPS